MRILSNANFQRTLSGVLFLFSFILILIFLRQNYFAQENRLTAACDFIHDKIYLKGEVIEKWHQQCRRLFSHRKEEELNYEDLTNLQKQMDRLHLSHLRLYKPEAVREIWTEQRKVTGLKCEFVDGVLFVTSILPKSSAAEAGVRRGDIILSINQESPDVRSAETLAGVYQIERLVAGQKQKMEVQLKLQNLTEDQSFQLTQKEPQKFILKIPSFRKEYFEEKQFQKLSNRLMQKQELLKSDSILILDLRKNKGGSFDAGLKFLSLFLCQSEKVGYLKYKDHIEELQVPRPSFCLKNIRLRILIDFETASTAEMVALSLKEQRDARVFGSLSAGQLLVGVWYPWPQFGKGYEVSVPEAIYESAQGKIVEGQGVEPHHVLYYERSDFEKGQDTWELKAVSE